MAIFFIVLFMTFGGLVFVKGIEDDDDALLKLSFVLTVLSIGFGISTPLINFDDVPVEGVSIASSITHSTDGWKIETSDGDSLYSEEDLSQLELGDFVRYSRFKESHFWGSLFDLQTQDNQFIGVVAE